MTERMASYDVIIPRVLMQGQPCPQFVVLDAVQQVAVDFFKYRAAQKTKVDPTMADESSKAYPV